MSDTFIERRDHVIYAIWFGLALIALTIAITYRMDSFINPMSRIVGTAPVAGGSVSTVLAIVCGVYLIFRLIRPFPFVAKDVMPPHNLLYWVGTLLVTLSTVLIAAFLAWAAVFGSLLRSFRIVGLVLPLTLVIGFLLIEASDGRGEGTRKSYSPLYADAGVLSAAMLVPAVLAWFTYSSQRAGLARFVMGAIRDYSSMFVAFCVTAIIFFIWCLTDTLRARRRRNRLYSAAVDALWIYGITGFALVAVVMRYTNSRLKDHLQPRHGPLEEFQSFAYGQPLVFVGIVTFIWIVATVSLYRFQAKEEVQ